MAFAAWVPAHAGGSNPRASLTAPPEPSSPLRAPAPEPLHRTTIYHVVRRAVPYLPRAAHPADDDALAVALSLGDPVWLRARYVRSTAFIAESRRRARVYRGLHGTPAAPGLAAPTKPKRAPARALRSGRWLVAFGDGLPWRLAARDLVTFGETALGDVLTPGELVEERGTELRDVCLYRAAQWVLAVAKSPAGKVLRSFVCESRHPTRRVCAVEGFDGRLIAVAGGVVVLAGWRTPNLGGLGGLVKGLFGAAETGSSVDVGDGTEIFVIRDDGAVLLTSRMHGLLTNISARESGTGVTVLAKKVVAEKLDLTALEDVRSGRAFASSPDIKSSLVEFDIGDSIGEITDVGRVHVEVMDIVKPCDAKHHVDAYIGYNRATNRVGLWDLQGACWETQRGTLSGALYNPAHTHISLLLTDSEDSEPKMLFFDARNIASGPISEVVLEGLAGISTSVDGVWTDLAFEWSEDDAKIVKSAYELFAEKEWNDIESGFSSLGLR